MLLSRNQGPALRRSVAALEQAKNRAELELIVLDCGSSDESGRIDQEFPAVTVLRMPKHFGATRAYNIGIRTARGEFLLFLDPQIEVAPDAVAKMVERFEAEADTGGVCLLVKNEAGKVVSRVSALPGPDELSAALRNGGPPAAFDRFDAEAVTVEYAGWQALMVRKQFVAALNYLDARFGHFGADLDLAAQLRRSGKKIRMLCKTGAVWRPLDQPAAVTAAERGLLDGDHALAVAAFTGKYHGFFAGLRMRLSLVFWSLGQFLASILRARDISFAFHRFQSILTGQKIDGTQP